MPPQPAHANSNGINHRWHFRLADSAENLQHECCSLATYSDSETSHDSSRTGEACLIRQKLETHPRQAVTASGGIGDAQISIGRHDGWRSADASRKSHWAASVRAPITIQA